MAKVFSLPGQSVRIEGYGEATDKVPAEVPESVAVELERVPYLRVEREPAVISPAIASFLAAPKAEAEPKKPVKGERE